jgi:hypothetical protein
MSEKTLIFIILCGILGIFLRRNYLNITTSFLQIIIGINTLMISRIYGNILLSYLIILISFILLIFMYSIAILLIKRRSTLQVNEHTELRG